MSGNANPPAALADLDAVRERYPSPDSLRLCLGVGVVPGGRLVDLTVDLEVVLGIPSLPWAGRLLGGRALAGRRLRTESVEVVDVAQMLLAAVRRGTPA